MADQKRSEDVLGEKWDRCIADTAIKTASGLGVGIVLSFILFKRKTWPVALGTGFGLGMGYSNCQNDFQQPNLLHGKRVKAPLNGSQS
ncbi:MICOS complex subunit Mic10-like [Mytilus trossulus]|uniref:MICOS complex subunit Mic10-like n=1 Tax=Mytilus trossulus TaxID=6551 RepID=UPI0030068F93